MPFCIECGAENEAAGHKFCAACGYQASKAVPLQTVEAAPGTMDVAIFWDYENVRVPRDVETAAAVLALQEKVLALPGTRQIIDQRLYYDSHKDSERRTDRINLSELGFTLVDCPSRVKSQKETVDKKLIVDAMRFGCIESARSKTRVVLITSDGDFAYLLSNLRVMQVDTVVIHGAATTTANILLNACHLALSWHHDILASGPGDGEEVAFRAPVDEFTTELGGDFLDRVSSQSDSEAFEGRHLLICNCVHTSALNRDGWALDSTVAEAFYKKRGITDAAKYQAVRAAAEQFGFVEVGRLDLRGSEKRIGVVPSSTWDSVKMTGYFSKTHYYLRLTSEGKEHLEGEIWTAGGFVVPGPPRHAGPASAAREAQCARIQRERELQTLDEAGEDSPLGSCPTADPLASTWIVPNKWQDGKFWCHACKCVLWDDIVPGSEKATLHLEGRKHQEACQDTRWMGSGGARSTEADTWDDRRVVSTDFADPLATDWNHWIVPNRDPHSMPAWWCRACKALLSGEADSSHHQKHLNGKRHLEACQGIAMTPTEGVMGAMPAEARDGVDHITLTSRQMLEAMLIFLAEASTDGRAQSVRTVAKFWNQFFSANPQFQELKPEGKATEFLADQSEWFAMEELEHGQSSISVTPNGREVAELLSSGRVRMELVDALVLFLSRKHTQSEHGPYMLSRFWNQFWSSSACVMHERPTSKATEFLAGHSDWFMMTVLEHGQSSIGLTWEGSSRADGLSQAEDQWANVNALLELDPIDEGLESEPEPELAAPAEPLARAMEPEPIEAVEEEAVDSEPENEMDDVKALLEQLGLSDELLRCQENEMDLGEPPCLSSPISMRKLLTVRCVLQNRCSFARWLILMKWGCHSPPPTGSWSTSPRPHQELWRRSSLEVRRAVGARWSRSLSPSPSLSLTTSPNLVDPRLLGSWTFRTPTFDLSCIHRPSIV